MWLELRMSFSTKATWNETSSENHHPYAYSKVLAERLAWEIAGSQDRWDLVAVNPGLVLGPALSSHTTSESMRIIREFGNGYYRLGVPQGNFGDCRRTRCGGRACQGGDDGGGRREVHPRR